ncbi:HoxN/HupN/NixA family nickel/cobalt transporter [Allokutzneria sp. NRRL B-24872]|uniref:HoxN/HupN/NixA family nickel/cobalt transporter n=1 Tax=Allokutzneria sp. NRRL B-24872 TaxID=1137961 RepID=UPI000A370FDA|nr:HoxN/HupN/NixA family nickel/cobalt transporter [Allokutzneria sp. NRRL B-24872]
MTSLDAHAPSGAWTAQERRRLFGIIGAIVLLHVLGIGLYLAHADRFPGSGILASAGAIAYVLGVRHAFDADHIAAIDDTTRLMLLRGKRPIGVGFFFAMGHSSVVLVLALIVSLAAGTVAESEVEGVQEVTGTIATIVAISFLLLVAVLNAGVLRSLTGLWRKLKRGQMAEAEVERVLVNRGVFNRIFGGRLRVLIRSSWHMYPVGFLMGLGLDTASEITLLGLTATHAAGGQLPLVAVLSLPLIFAAGMSTFDTLDSLLMTRAYSWSYRNPVRTLFYNTVTTAITVAIAGFVVVVYVSQLLAEKAGMAWLAGIGEISEQFEVMGYGIAATFLLAWGGAVLWWKARGYEDRHPAIPVGE